MIFVKIFLGRLKELCVDQTKIIMPSPQHLKWANLLRTAARYTLLVIGTLVLVFALFSGAEQYGGGLVGVVQNAPNALPAALLLVMVYVAWRWELLGGILITLLGAMMLYFFNVGGNNFYWIVFLTTLLIVMLGLCLIGSAYLRSRR